MDLNIGEECGIHGHVSKATNESGTDSMFQSVWTREEMCESFESIVVSN